jgi:hypothetical protein
VALFEHPVDPSHRFQDCVARSLLREPVLFACGHGRQLIVATTRTSGTSAARGEWEAPAARPVAHTRPTARALHAQRVPIACPHRERYLLHPVDQDRDAGHPSAGDRRIGTPLMTTVLCTCPLSGTATPPTFGREFGRHVSERSPLGRQSVLRTSRRRERACGPTEIGVWSSMLRQLLPCRSSALPEPPLAPLLTPFSSRCPLFARGAEDAHS